MAQTKKKQASEATVSSKLRLGGDLTLGALVAELVGVFILTFAVLNTQGNAIVAALTVLILVLMLSRLSGGHVNPAVTIGLAATKQITMVRAAGYLVAQFLGAMLAVVVASNFMGQVTDPATGEAAKLFTVKATGDWKPFFGEFVGAIVFGFGVAAAVIGRRQGYDAAFTVGGALLLGLVVAVSGSAAILNPAVALGLGVFDVKNWWSIWAYGLAPLLGLSAGAWLYKLLQADVDANSKPEAIKS